MTIPVFYLSLKPETPCNNYWDYGLLNDFLNGNLWQPPNFPEFDYYEGDEVEESDIAVVVIPARHHADKINEINKQLIKSKKVVLFLMGDEEHIFPVEKIKHGSIYIWVQNPQPGRHDKYSKLGTGYPPFARKYLGKKRPKKTTDVFFAGQVTHKRRHDMIANLEDYNERYGHCDILKTEGFTQGYTAPGYYKRFEAAKIAPAPSGPETPDSFRLFEALEAMAIPLADECDPHNRIDGYWNWLFDQDCPFPLVKEWDNLTGFTINQLEAWPENVNRQTAWWIRWKRDFAYKVCSQITGNA